MGKNEAAVVRQWQLNPFLLLEASESAVELVVKRRDRSARHNRADGSLEADAPTLELYAASLATARAWRDAVYPPTRSGGYAVVMRARAFGDLEVTGLAPDARMVTEFLAAWHAQADDSGHQPMSEYAVTWKGLMYAS